jgi:multiple sugar transport system substrate-binding protein
LAALLMLSLLSGCLMPQAMEPDVGRGRSPRALPSADHYSVVTWSFWASPWELEINRRVARAFEREHPRIRVELIDHSWDEYFPWLTAEWAAGRSPDVMFMNYVPVRAAQGMLADLEPRIAADRLDVGDFHPALLSLYRYEGHLYGLPRDNDTKVIYYNQRAFDRAGQPYPQPNWTWDDLRTLARALTVRDAEGHVQRYGFAYEAALWWRLWVWQNGGDVVDDPLNPRRFVLDSAEGIEALEYLRALTVEDGSTPPPELTTSEEITRLFRQERLAMAFGGHGKVPVFAEDTDLRWDVVALPRGRQAANVAGGAGYSLSRIAADPEAAWELLSFLSGPKGQGLFAESGLITPARRSVREDNIFLRRQPYNPSAFLDGTTYGRANLHALRGDELNAALDRALLPVWRGERGVAEALAGVRPEAERLLAP